jgi:DsbC/DsbD-like thiol-disulfide interchange protein
MKILSALFLLGFLVLSIPGTAQVRASLVAADASAQPGRPLTVAIELVHAPTWHTYWVNAGTGYPTRIRWELPSGWTPGEIQWPTPTTIVAADNSVTGNGYTGTVLLPVVLTVPPGATAGQQVTLKAHVSWLMCSDQCIPGEGDAMMNLNVSAQTPAPNTAIRAELAKMPMPQPPGPGALRARRAGTRILLSIAADPGARQPHFFSEDGLVAYDEPQQATLGPNTLDLTLPVSSDEAPQTSRLVGVLAYTASDGTYKGIRVDVACCGVSNGAPQASDSSGQGAASTLAALLLALLGGMILNLMPCVFPVLGIKVMTFVSQAGSARRKLVLPGLAYSAAVLLLISALYLGWSARASSATDVCTRWQP